MASESAGRRACSSKRVGPSAKKAAVAGTASFIYKLLRSVAVNQPRPRDSFLLGPLAPMSLKQSPYAYRATATITAVRAT